MPRAAERRQARVEGGLPHAVEDHVGAAATGYLADNGGEVLVGGHEVGARLLGEHGLRRGRRGGDHRAAEVLDQLGEQQADAAGRRVHYREGSLGDRERAAAQVVRGQPLQHDGGRDPQVNAVRHGYRLVGGNRDALSVAARALAPRDVVAGGELMDVLPHRDNRASALAARDVGHRVLVDAGTTVDVDEVDAGRRDLDDDLARPGDGLWPLPWHHRLGTAKLTHHDRPHRITPLRCCRHVIPITPARRLDAAALRPRRASCRCQLARVPRRATGADVRPA